MKKENNRWWACTHGELLEVVGLVGGGAWHAMTSVPEPEAGEFMSDRREWIRSRERAEAHRCLKTTVRRQDSSARKPRGPPREDLKQCPLLQEALLGDRRDTSLGSGRQRNASDFTCSLTMHALSRTSEPNCTAFLISLKYQESNSLV